MFCFSTLQIYTNIINDEVLKDGRRITKILEACKDNELPSKKRHFYILIILRVLFSIIQYFI